jgi:hypothetical protein
VLIENRLEVQAAPSGLWLDTGGTSSAMIELRGSAIPRTPLKLGASGSIRTLFTAADS